MKSGIGNQSSLYDTVGQNKFSTLAGHAQPAEGIVRQHFLPEGVGMYRLGVPPLLKGYKGTGGLYIITVSLF